MLRADTVKIRDVLAGLQKPGDALILGAMMLRNERGIFDATGIPDLGSVGITLEQERLWSSTGRVPDHGHDDETCPPNSHAVEATLPYTNGKR
jgi:hypothetical protein